MENLTTAHWICLGLVALAAYLHRAKLFGPPAVAPAAPPPQVLARYVEPAPAPAPPSLPPPPSQLAGLLHASIQAEATTRAVTRGVEGMIEDSSRRVVLPWAPAPASPPPPAVPNG